PGHSRRQLGRDREGARGSASTIDREADLLLEEIEGDRRPAPISRWEALGDRMRSPAGEARLHFQPAAGPAEAEEALSRDAAQVDPGLGPRPALERGTAPQAAPGLRPREPRLRAPALPRRFEEDARPLDLQPAEAEDPVQVRRAARGR